MLVVGGAAESLEVEVGTYRLVLKNRKGFVKIAMQTGKIKHLNIFFKYN